jgi:hypothetical protein
MRLKFGPRSFPLERTRSPLDEIIVTFADGKSTWGVRSTFRLLTQTVRILQIDGLRSITLEVVVAARESVVIGID